MPFWVLHIHTHSKPNPCWNKSPLLLSEHTYHILCITHIHLNKVRPNTDIAPHLQSSWSWSWSSWSSSSSPSSSSSSHHDVITSRSSSHENSPPPLNDMLPGVITSTLSSWGVKFRHPLWTIWAICWLGCKHQLYLHSHLKSDAAQRQGCSEYVWLGQFEGSVASGPLELSLLSL
jgi:hypothetical protein